MRIPRWGLMAAGLLPLIALFALLVWGLLRPGAGDPGGLAIFTSTGEVKVVRPEASDFSLTLYDGQPFTFSSLRGQPVLLDFWASWCLPCLVEAETLESVWRQYEDRGVVFVGIGIWDSDDSARAFIQEFDTSYLVGPDPKGEIAVEYGVTGIPEKYFIDANGQVVRKLVGPMDEARLTQALDELLGEP